MARDPAPGPACTWLFLASSALGFLSLPGSSWTLTRAGQVSCRTRTVGGPVCRAGEEERRQARSFSLNNLSHIVLSLKLHLLRLLLLSLSAGLVRPPVPCARPAEPDCPPVSLTKPQNPPLAGGDRAPGPANVEMELPDEGCRGCRRKAAWMLLSLFRPGCRV